MIDSFNLSSQATRAMNYMEFNNVFFLKLFFLIIFTIYFLTNTTLNDKNQEK